MRPRKPLISRRATLEMALTIIDEEGLEALSIRRLGRALNVHGISLYYHFENKDAILVGAASLALSKVRTPDPSMLDWREWLLRNAVAYQKALLDHPNLIPLFMRRHALGIGVAEINASASLLAAQGLPSHAIMPLIEALEAVALGSATYLSATGGDSQREGWKADYPVLYHLSRQTHLGWDQLFEAIVRATIDGVMNAASAAAPVDTASRP